MSYRHGNEDRLSHLPEEILSQILSLMPTKIVVRTSTLSKSWRYKWTLVTNLDFEDHHPVDGLDCLSNFVDRALTFCNTSKINRFRLCLPRYGLRTTSESMSNISNWINEVVRLNVCEVDLYVTPFELPISLFTCKTLTKLSLAGIGLEDFIGPNVDFILPLLKTLHIKCPINLPGKVSVNAFRLINACPILESLSLDIVTCYEEEDYNFNIPTLKRLKLRIMGRISINKVILNVPNLEDLSVVGLLSSFFVIENLSSLVKATVKFSYMEEELIFLYAELLNGIRRAKSISWSSPSLDVLLKLPLPIFPNVTYLEYEGSLNSNSLLLFRLLEMSSELEHLCFQEPKESRWIEPLFVPNWMLTKIKTMKITKCKGRKCDRRFIEYVLGNSKVLKKLTITCKKSLGQKDEERLCARLLKFQRASRNCKIHFVGKWLLNIF